MDTNINIARFARGITAGLAAIVMIFDVSAGVVGKSTPAGFTDDFDAACAEASKSGKKILAVFTGSDWCHWCKMLEKDYLSKPEFVEEAGKDFVLLFIDSPKDKSLLSDAARGANDSLVKKYKISGFPTVKILKADGSDVIDARPRNGITPQEYVAQLRLADTPEGRFDKLISEIKRDFSAVVHRLGDENKFRVVLDLAEFVVEPLEGVGTNYLPRCRALRAEVEKMSPNGTNEALLAKIDATSTLLEKCQNRDVEGLVDFVLCKMNEAKSEDEHLGEGWSPLAISLVSACEFPSPGRDVYGVRLNLLAGTHNDVAGLDVGGLCNSVSNGMYGVQFCGLCNIGAQCTRGMQFAGLFNIGGWEFAGMQAAGLFNIGGWEFAGMQAAGLVNLAGDVSGAQLSGLGNIGLRINGFQVSGGGNIAAIVKGAQVGGAGNNIALVLDGLQVAGEMNSAYRLRGFQCSAIVNSGSVLDGVQLSAINLSDTCCGLQVGVVNYANEMHGCQIGLCNIISSSSVPVLPVVNVGF